MWLRDSVAVLRIVKAKRQSTTEKMSRMTMSTATMTTITTITRPTLHLYALYALQIYHPTQPTQQKSNKTNHHANTPSTDWPNSLRARPKTTTATSTKSKGH
jgi:hypothetical protein